MSSTTKLSLPARVQAAFRFFYCNWRRPQAWRDFDFGFLCRTVGRGDARWPWRVRKWTRGCDVLDIGCGRNFAGYGFLSIGARSYTGMDPTLDLDDDRVKDSRATWSSFERSGLSPRALMERFPRLQFSTQTVESFTPAHPFDAIVMHNVTEHLMNISDIFARLPGFLRENGRIVFRHPNYYCWHGHHMKPRTVAELNLSDPKQKTVADWAHVRPDPVVHEWIFRTQNRIRLDELRALTEKYFEIEIWRENESRHSHGLERLTQDILDKYPEFERRELATDSVFIVARKR